MEKIWKIISGVIAFTMITGVALPTLASAQDQQEQKQRSVLENASTIQKLSSYVSKMNYDQFNRYIFDTENFLNEDKELQNLYNSLYPEDKVHFWDSINTARIPVTSEPSSQIGPQAVPIIYFVAVLCARIIASRIAQAAVTFTAHAVTRANQRGITTDK